MKQVISFDKLKLTNNQLDDNGHVSLMRAFRTQRALIHLQSLLRFPYALHDSAVRNVKCNYAYMSLLPADH